MRTPSFRIFSTVVLTRYTTFGSNLHCSDGKRQWVGLKSTPDVVNQDYIMHSFAYSERSTEGMYHKLGLCDSYMYCS